MREVFVSDRDSARYMVGGEKSIASVMEQEAAEQKTIAEEDAAHDKWFAARKSNTYLPTEHDAVILADARRHLEGARRLPMPVLPEGSAFDSRWLGWSEACYKEIGKFKTCEDVIHHAQRKVPFDHREVVEGHKNELYLYKKLLSEEFPFRYENQQMKLYENPRAIPETLLLADGRLTSNVFYWHMRTMFRCQTDISPLHRIIEIGGGYGSLARLWMIDTVSKIDRYVIVDLPESLFFSEVCLRVEFGDQVGYWEGVDPKTRIVLLPVPRIREYHETSDLVINVGALQEMNDEWVSFYMQWLDTYRPKYFYSLNYMGSPLSTLFESRNFWSPRPSTKWTTRSIDPDPPLVKMMCSGRCFAEVIYEYSKPARTFFDWSVLHGSFLNRRTYLEGLELLRQYFTIPHARLFLSVAAKGDDDRQLPMPKEILFIASLVQTHANDPGLAKFVETLGNAKKYGTY